MKRLPWFVPELGGGEQARVAGVLASGFVNDGEVTTELETRLAALLGVPHAVAVTSGTAALFLALAAAGVGHGDEVLVPDVTFIATASAVSLAGATPVLVDVLPDTLGMDPRAAAAAITPRTRALVPVHVSGRAAPLPALLDLARDRGLLVVEDAAEALGSSRFGAALGTHGELGCFSFSPLKTLTTGQGGLVVTRDPALHRRLRELKDQGRPVRGTGGDDEHVSVGFNFKLTNLQAALGLAQLADLERRLAQRRWLLSGYRRRLAGHPRITLLPFDLEGGEVPQWIDALVDDRDELCLLLRTHGIETRKLWRPLHTQAPYAAPAGRFPSATEVCARAVWLPSGLSMTDEDLDRVCDLVWKWTP